MSGDLDIWEWYVIKLFLLDVEYAVFFLSSENEKDESRPLEKIKQRDLGKEEFGIPENSR